MSKVFYEQYDTFCRRGSLMVRVQVLKIKDDMIEMAGVGPKCAPGKNKKMFITNEKGDDMPFREFPMPYRNVYDENGKLEAEYTGFRAKLPLYDGAVYRFTSRRVKKNGQTEIKEQGIRFGRHSRLLNTEDSFVKQGSHIIRCVDDSISVEKAGLLLGNSLKHKFNNRLREEGKEELIAFRSGAEKLKKSGKPIVLISDRVNMARDNGEALFKYLMANGYDSEYDIYFAVLKDTPDYERLSRIGKVLDFGSDEYKEKFLAADKIITSGFDGWFSNAFGEDYRYMADLYEFDHYFLQHGIIMNDWSKALNYANTGFKAFITSAEGEYRSILGESYGYNEDEVRLTGLARYDYLEDEHEKLIVIAPTWRKDLAGEVDREHGSRFYSEAIKGSSFHEFYQGLINNETLLSAMRDNGYKGEFYLHPSFIANFEDFKGNDLIDVLRDADYNRLFRKASILITDYSSVNMDFAYLNKPVIYSQFDRDSFFENHGCESGYFDYERDGFGPVCTTVQEVTDNIVSLIRNDCRMEQKYIERTDNFFYYRDRQNCRRIADVIFGEHQERG